ncbi:MAG: hypothetical protein ACYTF1_06695 [Planctomycetota bacterium]|jgi:endonuclease III
MKHGSEYAKRVRRLYYQLIRKFGRPAEGEPTDPIEQLVLSILSLCTSTSKAKVVYRKLLREMVDLNELRVTPTTELVHIFGSGFPLARQKAQCVIDSLNAIRRRQDALDLSFLKQRGRREARDYLESLEGVDRSVAARVLLYSLGGHAIPVDNLTLYILRKEEIVDTNADAAEVQGFLERHISAKNAKAFTELLDRYVSAKGAHVPVNQLSEMLAPEPPPVQEVVLAGNRPETSSGKKVSDSEKTSKKSVSAKSKPAPKDARKKNGAAESKSARSVSKAKKTPIKSSKRTPRKAK